MNLNLNKKIINILIIFFLGIQVSIYIYNQKPLTKNFSQKKITVENFSSIVLSKSGINKIGSEKLNKIDEDNIYLEGNSYLENKDYKIYGKNISINLSKEISNSDEFLLEMRNELRSRMKRSHLCDGKYFASEIEKIYNNIWKQNN